jgi:hypothetical protein
MKQAWGLCTSRADLAAKQIISWYGKRFSILETFRDQKDLRVGMGPSGMYIFQAIATYRTEWTRALLDRFAQFLSEPPWFSQTFGVI